MYIYILTQSNKSMIQYNMEMLLDLEKVVFQQHLMVVVI